MDILDVEDIADGLRGQAEHCLNNDAPITASIIIAQIALMDGDTKCGQKIRNLARKTAGRRDAAAIDRRDASSAPDRQGSTASADL